MTEHLSTEALYLFLVDDPVLDHDERAAITAHLVACVTCTVELHDLQRFNQRVSAGHDVIDYLDRPDPERVIVRTAVLVYYTRYVDDGAVADDFLAELLDRPPDQWETLFAKHPHQLTAGLAARVLSDVETQIKRRPRYALHLISAAEALAPYLTEAESLATLTDVWLQRSNAYRHIGDYPAALDAAQVSADLASELSVSDYPHGRALHAAAGALFKMTDYTSALHTIERAIALLNPFGLNLPLARALMLRATIHIEQGDIATAQREYAELLPIFRGFDNRIEEARILANLADCDLRLANYEQAAANADLAIQRYLALKMDAEAVRSNWTLDLARLRLGVDDALGDLHVTSAAFEQLGMLTDAGFVRLDITEELLQRGEWDEAAPIARELVDIFTRAKVTLAKIEALDQLRRAVDRHAATPDFVRSVRAYLSIDDPQQPFTAPQTN